jgi:hypothetical protein
MALFPLFFLHLRPVIIDNAEGIFMKSVHTSNSWLAKWATIPKITESDTLSKLPQSFIPDH